MLDETMVGKSKAFREVLRIADLYARSSFPILVTGETGVGKEGVVRRIHAQSKRRLSPFFPINCGALPPGLFESELFGYERGAFSGAVQASKGILRQAHGGTVFFDEIGDLELPLQVKLLRFLELGEVRAIGGQRIERADVRIIAATNVDLREASMASQFRLDLYERISVLELRIPPLRERREDIPLLAQHFARLADAEFDPQAEPSLCNFAWPGNVRELRNVVYRAAVQGDGVVSEAEIRRILDEKSLAEKLPKADLLASGSLQDIEKEAVFHRLRQCQGNRKRTARELGIAKSTLHEKLKKWRSEDHTSLALSGT